MFRFYHGIFVLVLFQYVVPIYSTADGCSANCSLKNGNHTTGPPSMKFKAVSKSVAVKSSLNLKCKICHSNPAATIEWFFNGKPLNFKKDRMYHISTPCQQTLYLLTVFTEDEGNFTCVAKNKFGEASSTTEVNVFGYGCSKECVSINGKLKVGNKRKGPPRMKFERQFLPNTINSMVKITCPLCESNPPSILSWYYNGSALDLKSKKIQVISDRCKETLYFRALKNYEGKYTCVAKNDLGQANATTKLEIYDTADESKPSIAIKLEAEAGTFSGNNVKIDSRFNITCELLTNTNCLAITWSWKKNGKVIRQNETKNTQLKQSRKEESSVKRCTTKLVIDKAMANSTDKYQCKARGWSFLYTTATSTSEPISINAVPCFKGFYCRTRSYKATRCPNRTFTMHQNATDLKQCEPCHALEPKNETFLAPFMNPETAKIFPINCHIVTENSDNTSSLSTGEIAAIAVPSLFALIIIVILASWYGMRNCRDYKRLAQPPPAGAIQIEIPDVPQSKDVFVCYSSKNREWVHEELFPKLKAQDFETFIDFVDFEIGVPILKNIVNGIYGSRKTIFVLSRDSLRSYYARTELSQALVAGRQTGHQVIVILYEKCKVPEEISNIVYLDWTDEEKRGKFWEKLYEAVRKSPENEVEA